MIKPIYTTNTSHRGYRNIKINNKMQAEKLQRLIVDFEEQAKKQPNNVSLKNHIEQLKNSLAKFLPQ